MPILYLDANKFNAAEFFPEQPIKYDGKRWVVVSVDIANNALDISLDRRNRMNRRIAHALCRNIKNATTNKP